ncbi:MAG: YIP1 family protein [Deltaproteobacteria bacterium]|nr:YIP1 family protein [Deltaproteobacteria bacterium]
MIAKCARCQYVFTTERYGRQFCPSCGAELMLPAPPGTPEPSIPVASPGAPPPPAAAPAEPGPSAPQLPPPGAAGTGPTAGEGARCAAHPDRFAAGVCGRCGAFACSECLQVGPDGLPQCLACRERVGLVEPTPWEERDKRGLLAAYFETVKRSFTEPTKLFERMPVQHAKGALSYFWITTALGGFAGQLWSALLSPLMHSGPKLPAEHPLAPFLNSSSSPLLSLAMGVAIAALAPLLLYFNAGLFHLGLLLFKSGKNGFNATLRAVAYSSGPGLLQIVPLCGGAIGGLWTLVLVVIALSKTQRTSVGAAIGAVLVPIALLSCCACGVLAIAMALGMTAAAAALNSP